MIRFFSALVLLLAPVAARSAVAYVGAGTFSSGTAGCTPSTTGVTMEAGDLLLVIVESENQTISLTTANGFTEAANSPQGTGTTAGNRIAVYWKEAASAADSMPVVADSGDHNTCQLLVFRYVDFGGSTPFAVTAGGVLTPANTAAPVPGATTGVANTMVVAITGNSANTTGTATCSAASNANLRRIQERADATNTAGAGGGFCAYTGYYSGTGSYGTTTITQTSSLSGLISLAIKPKTTGIFGYGPTPNTNTTSNPAANFKVTNKHTLSEDGDVSRVCGFHSATTATTSRAVIYSDNSGTPNTRLGVSDERSAAMVANTFNCWTFSTPVSLSAGTYWIGSIATASISGYTDTGAAGSGYYNSDTYSDGATDPFGSGTSTTSIYGYFAVYSPPAPAPTVIPVQIIVN